MFYGVNFMYFYWQSFVVKGTEALYLSLKDRHNTIRANQVLERPGLDQFHQPFCVK